MFKTQNLKLSTALEKAENKLNNFEVFLDVEKTAVTLQNLELHNSKLQDTNIKIMEQLYEEKKKNQRLRVLENDLASKNQDLKILEKSNNTLLERFEKMKRLYGKENEKKNGGEVKKNMFKKKWGKTSSSGGNHFGDKDSVGTKNQGMN